MGSYAPSTTFNCPAGALPKASWVMRWNSPISFGADGVPNADPKRTLSMSAAGALPADAGGNGAVASHFAGPTWQSNSGGSVVGTVADRCVPDPASIAWLSLNGVPNGPGIFSKVNFIQRLNTVGGNPPSTPRSTIGQEAKIPYTADYLFYNAP